MLYYNIFIYNVYTIECIYYYWLKYVIVPISLYNVRDFVVLNENFLISLFQREIFWFRCFQREFLWFRSFRWFRRNYPISPKSERTSNSRFFDISPMRLNLVFILLFFFSFFSFYPKTSILLQMKWWNLNESMNETNLNNKNDNIFYFMLYKTCFI